MGGVKGWGPAWGGAWGGGTWQLQEGERGWARLAEIDSLEPGWAGEGSQAERGGAWGGAGEAVTGAGRGGVW